MFDLKKTIRPKIFEWGQNNIATQVLSLSEQCKFLRKIRFPINQQSSNGFYEALMAKSFTLSTG